MENHKTLADAKDYKEFIELALHLKSKIVGRSFTYQSLARACGVQKTYLSRVMNGDAHLNADQLYLAADFLKLGSHERALFTLLHEYDRSKVASRKTSTRGEIDLVRKRMLSSSAHVKADFVSPEKPAHDPMAVYYLEPDLQLVTIFLTIERYAKDVRRLRSLLGLSEEEFAGILSTLSELGLIAFAQDRYQVLKMAMHLAPESPVFRPHRKLVRLKALERSDRKSPDKAMFFTVFFSADETTAGKVREKFLDFLKEAQKEIERAPSEEVYYMSFDLMPWI